MRDILDGKTASAADRKNAENHMGKCESCASLSLVDCQTYGKLQPMALKDKNYYYPVFEMLLNHEDSCRECDDWSTKRFLLANGVENPDAFSCVHVAMRSLHLCDQHEDAWECPDTLLVQLKDGRYAMPIRDGGTSSIPITHCPWCGVKL